MKLSVAPPPADHLEAILSGEAVAFLAQLHGAFGTRRNQLLAARRERSAPTGFASETAHIRSDEAWRVTPPAEDYLDRRVEITGPTDRKLVINALNSGASGFMADFEDANSPTWRNQVEGQFNLRDAIDGTITYDASDGRHYELVDDGISMSPTFETATLRSREPCSTSACSRSTAPLASCNAAGMSTCICPSSSTISRRDCGMTS
jgi:malate synthase